MARRVYVFGDEAGDPVFQAPGEGVSRYFLIGTITVEDCGIGDELLALKRDLAFSGMELEKLHASSDKQWVRNRVFETIAKHDGLRYDVTILDKRKTIEKYRKAPIQFYKLAWYFHLKYVAPRVATSDDELLVAAASISISKKKQAVKEALESVVAQVAPTMRSVATFPAMASDPCLQAADYLTWAVQRTYEGRKDTRSYEQIEHLIRSEFQPFKDGELQY
jgi:hypothetical protein